MVTLLKCVPCSAPPPAQSHAWLLALLLFVIVVVVVVGCSRVPVPDGHM
jgi:hypothetical protein